MREIGSAAMPIIPSFDGIKANLERGLNGPLERAGADGGRRFGESAGRNLTASLNKHAKRASLLAAGAVAGAGYAAFRFGQDAVDLAADLEQSVGAIDTVFGKSAKRMHRWAKGAANDVGLTRNEFNELGTLIGSQLKNGGTAMERLAPKTRKLIGLGADLSSMFGGTTKEAVEALSSALKGERDPIERYGVTLNQSKIDAEAAALGYKKVGKEWEKGAVQAATLSLITKQTADAQGNFAKESDTLSGKQQRLRASLENTKTEIGTALLPIITEAADYLLKEGVPAFQNFADWFSEKGAPAIGDFADDMKPLAKEILPAVVGGIEDLAGFLKDAAPYAKDVVGAFNDMPDWAKKGLVLGGAGLAVTSKVKGKAGGLFGGTGSNLTDPAYVYVVNGGSGSPTGGPAGGGKVGLLSQILALGGASVVADNAPAIYSGLKTSDGPGGSATVKEIRKALEDSDVGKYAEKFGIDLEALSQGLATNGKNSQEFKDAVEKLRATNDGAWEHVNDLIPVVGSWITTNGDKAAWALKDLQGVVDNLGTHLNGLLSGDPTGESIDVTNTWSKIPDAKLKVLQDPDTIKTRQDVRDLLQNVDGLTKKDFRLIFQALGLAKAKTDAEVLLTHMRELTGMKLPDGFNGPFRGGARPSATGGGLGFNIGSVNVSANDTRGLLSQLNAIQRRRALGGY